MDDGARRDRRRHRVGRAEPSREAQRDEPDAQRRDGRRAARARRGRRRRRARAHRRRRLVLRGHGPEGVLPRGRRAAPSTSSAACAAMRTTGSGASCAPTRSRRSPWSTAGASAARSPRSSPATSRSPPTRRPSASPRSTGASRPAALVSRGLAETIGVRDALLYIMTGRTFDGRKAAEMRLVNWSLPRAELRERGREPRARAAREEPRRRCAPRSSGSSTRRR